MFLTSDTLVCHKVRIGSVYSCGHCWFVLVYTDAGLCGGFHDLSAAVHSILAIMLFLTVHQQIDISCLDVVHVVAAVQLIGIVNL